MKKAASIAMFAVLLLASCNKYYNHVMRGVVYTDSSKTTPMAGSTLVFTLPDWLSYIDGNYVPTPLGCAVSDAAGRWAFSFNHMQDDDRIKGDPVRVLITCDGATLYIGDADVPDTLQLYPL